MRRLPVCLSLLGIVAVGCSKSEPEAPAPKPPVVKPEPVKPPEPPPPPPEPTATEMVAKMTSDCAASADARKARHAAKPLWDRLGGDEKTLALLTEVIRLHKENGKIKHYFDKVDSAKLARTATDFFSANTGGKAKYKGKDLKTAHAAMNLTDEDFMEAGKDALAAMKNLGYGPEETEEVACIFVSLHDQVVAAK